MFFGVIVKSRPEYIFLYIAYKCEGGVLLLLVEPVGIASLHNTPHCRSVCSFAITPARGKGSSAFHSPLTFDSSYFKPTMRKGPLDFRPVGLSSFWVLYTQESYHSILLVYMLKYLSNCSSSRIAIIFSKRLESPLTANASRALKYSNRDSFFIEIGKSAFAMSW